MPKKLTLPAILVLLGFAFAGVAEANVLFVCADCPVPEGYYRSLTEAVDSASTGDTIYVRRGYYECEPLVIAKALTILGRERDSVLFANTSMLGGPLITLTSSGCIIRNCTFLVTGIAGMDNAAITVRGVTATIADNCFRVSDYQPWPAAGIICQDGATPSISRNNFLFDGVGANYAVRLVSSSASVSAASNYWGSANADSVAAVIFDSQDDAQLGTVSTSPHQTSAY